MDAFDSPVGIERIARHNAYPIEHIVPLFLADLLEDVCRYASCRIEVLVRANRHDTSVALNMQSCCKTLTKS